ncbi:prenyltransferase/squalene oxidase repeat-containing protein [Planctellipticum variicoloris]|uniref:prenyltransferase/squalene oxidase repeat-containing protein n=1 Tax=Planctellipticum variicoloris TaxID=3064265 RepID=UPI0030136364|nr:terpene cyclase/mutase family protein [Planctomycetaceae bacterium SH412]
MRWHFCRLFLAGVWLLVSSSAFLQAQTDEEISAARLKGVEYLKFTQGKDGSWEYENHAVGITALCTLALIENGTPIYDPVVEKGYRFVRKNCAGEKQTYDLALSILLLSRVGDRQDRGQIRTMGARLLAGQTKSGGWSYSNPEVDASIFSDLRKIEKKDGAGDNSNTQFAVLGLWVSSRYGVPIDDAMIEVAARFVGEQKDDGGWPYTSKDEGSRNTMTSAGLFCLTVARANRIRKDQKSSGGTIRGQKETLLSDPVYAKGLERVNAYAKGMSPGSARYFIWSIERLGVLLGVEKLGDTDWFRQGAAALLKTQKADGSWPDSKESPSDTCFAVLFLRKANLGSDISRLLAGEPDQVFLLANREDKPRFDTLQEALAGAKAGDVIRVDGNGPYKLLHDVIDKDLTIQAGYGYEPVFEYQVGKSDKGLILRPERDVDAQHMLKIAGGTVTLEGLRLQFDPPVTSNPVPWKGIHVTGGALRLLNCQISEGNKRGMTGVVIAAPGRHVIRNSLLIGGNSALEIVSAGEQNVLVENSILYSGACISFSNSPEKGVAGDVKLMLSQNVFQGKDAFTASKWDGKLAIGSTLCAYKCDNLGTSLLKTSTSAEGRSWSGDSNIYNLTSWLGGGGKRTSTVSDPKSFSKFFGEADRDGGKLPLVFVVPRRVGSYAHVMAAQDWDISEKSELSFLARRPGVRPVTIGPGEGYSRYREDFQYNEWRSGNVQPLAAVDLKPVK